jgi:hypothetical protein
VIVLVPALWAASQVADAQNVDAERYAQVKASYLLNLVRLTEWPESAFEDGNAPITILVIGEDRLTTYLGALVRGERVAGRHVVLHELEDFRPGTAEGARRLESILARAQLLYIGHSEQRRFGQIVAIAAAYPVLTVSDIPGFADQGGMIGLVVRGGRVGLVANLDRIRSSPVRVSSRVLSLATLVDDYRRAGP